MHRRIGFAVRPESPRRIEHVIMYTQHENYSTEDDDADAAAATTTSYVQNVSAADGATLNAFGQHPLKKPLIPSIR